MKGYIYKYTSPAKKSYIGQTTTNPARRANAGEGYKGCVAFYDAIQKYGWASFTLEILEEIESDNLIDELNRLEMFYIDKFNTISPYGYNLVLGGNNKSLSGTQSAHWRKDIDDTILEQLYTKEHKNMREISELLNISIGTISRHLDALGIKNEKKYNTKIDQFTLDKQFIQTWTSASEAGRTLNINSNSIGVCCRKTGRRKVAGGYKWAYHKELPI